MAEEAQLPEFLRKNRSGGGVVKRAAGGGRKDAFLFLYPLVKEYFAAMREHARYIDAQDLEDHFLLQMQRYLEKAEVVGGVRLR